MAHLYELLGVPNSAFDACQFVTSWLLPAYILGTLRCLISLYCFTTIFYSWAWFATHTVVFHLQDIDIAPITFEVGAEGIRQSFSYFTYLSYWGLAFYFAFAGVHSITFASRNDCWLVRWPQTLQLLHTLFYSSIVCLPFLVSAVYWTSMWIGPWFSHDFDAWSAISIHALNSSFAVFEIVVPDTHDLPWSHLVVLLLIMGSYLGIAYITKATEGIYIYLWLDPKVGADKILAHIAGYTMAMVLIFNLVKASIWVRSRLTRRRKQGSHTGPRISYDSDHDALWYRQGVELQHAKSENSRIDMQSISWPLPAPRYSPVADLGYSAGGVGLQIPIPPEPEQTHHLPATWRSSTPVRNFARPGNQSTVSTVKHPGVWL